MLLPTHVLKATVETNPLVEAATSGNLAAVRALLAQGAEPEVIDQALSGAAANGQIDVVKFLLDNGARINAGEGDALSGAAANGQIDVVKFLLDKGAKIDAGEGDAGTALLRAVEGDHADIVTLLLDKGANMDAGDRQGTTPLIEAVEKNRAALVELLLRRGARTETNGGSALYQAALAGNLEILKLLLDKGANVNAQLGGGETILHVMATNGRAAIVKLLLENHANIEARDRFGLTPLMVTAQNDQVEAARQLLDAGAQIEARDTHGETAMHLAAHRASTAVLSVLLDRGAPIEARDNDGFTPLICAAEAGGVAHAGRNFHVDKYPAVAAVNLLLDRGANIEAKSNWGQTALHRAAFRDRPDAVKALLERGANLQAMDNHGETALSLARKNLQGFERLTTDRPCSPTSVSCQQSVDVMLTDRREVVGILQEAVDQHSPNSFADYVADLQDHPRDRARRDHVVQLAAALPELPPVPENAHRLYARASALMEEASGTQDLEQPLNLLRAALNVAPWWGEAYRQLSRALEMTGQYEVAEKNLNYYLALHPPEAEARAARDHLAKIQTMEAAQPKSQ
jgi:ankyrin repeat protein